MHTRSISSSPVAFLCLALLSAAPQAVAAGQGVPEPRWPEAYKTARPMTADEARAFMKRLAEYVVENHMKRDETSEQRGMIYEYFDVAKKGRHDQFVQGEGLDTMHDGAWFAVALAEAYRATGDDYYKQVLDRWVLPFYCRMLNHSDALFSAKVVHVRPDRAKMWTPTDEWFLREGEKGFVPYWWDDGASVSLDRTVDKGPDKGRTPAMPAFDRFVAGGKENSQFRLSGYSLGSSNHLAQDLGAMLLTNWLLFKDDPDARGRRWTKELAEAARNLQQCRTNHGHRAIPAVVAAAAVAGGDADLLKRLPNVTSPKWWDPQSPTGKNHYVQALYAFKPGETYRCPGFADDQEYYYYAGIARTGGVMTRPLAFRLVYDAYTHPMLYRYYCDDEPPPPGINVFDLHQFKIADGRFTDYRSDKKGPFNKPRPVGSRFGPQNMVVSGLALQAMKQHRGLWEDRYQEKGKEDLRVYVEDDEVAPRPVPNPGHLSERDYPEIWTEGFIKATPTGLKFCLGVKGKDLELTVYAGPDGKGSFARITARAGGSKLGSVSAVNDRGQPVRLESAQAGLSAGVEHFTFMATVPYTVIKGQNPWANGIEHGRYSFKLGQRARNFYLASTEDQVRRRLERELGRGLQTWKAIFDEYGYVPTGVGEPRWQRFSDTGGYAHLIKAAAQWVNYLEGRRDWDLHRVPAAK